MELRQELFDAVTEVYNTTQRSKYTDVLTPPLRTIGGAWWHLEQVTEPLHEQLHACIDQWQALSKLSPHDIGSIPSEQLQQDAQDLLDALQRLHPLTGG